MSSKIKSKYMHELEMPSNQDDFKWDQEIEHNLNTTHPSSVLVYQDQAPIVVDWRVIDENKIGVKFSAVYPGCKYVVVVHA